MYQEGVMYSSIKPISLKQGAGVESVICLSLMSLMN